jgi:hypothetical protein
MVQAGTKKGFEIAINSDSPDVWNAPDLGAVWRREFVGVVAAHDRDANPFAERRMQARGCK